VWPFDYRGVSDLVSHDGIIGNCPLDCVERSVGRCWRVSGPSGHPQVLPEIVRNGRWSSARIFRNPNAAAADAFTTFAVWVAASYETE
jgi:hypothetical protein